MELAQKFMFLTRKRKGLRESINLQTFFEDDMIVDLLTNIK